MEFSFEQSLEILAHTPAVLSALLSPLSEPWIVGNEGEGTWSAKEVVAHLIVCEQTDWLVRAEIILSGSQEPFPPIDMAGHFGPARSQSLPALLHEFQQLRESSLEAFRRFALQPSDWQKTGVHAKLGEVTLQQLVATWVAHDLTHLAQLARVLAKQQTENVGPFAAFLGVLKA